MSSNGSVPHAALSTVLATVAATGAWVRRQLARVRWLLSLAVGRIRAVLGGPVRRALVGPVRTGLLGRRVEVSLLVTLLAPLLALVAAWWVGGVGFETFLAWVEGTWSGTDPYPVVLVAGAALVALAIVSAGVNSGLLPTTLLVAGPVFGAAVTRYGTTVERGTGTAVVSLPEAVGVAALFAVAVGLPLAVVGFLLGVAARRVARTLLERSEPGSLRERI
jgi:hypothetical protein